MLAQENKERACRDLARRVAPIYERLNWKWNIPKPPRVPDEEGIYNKALELLSELESEENKGFESVGSGGIEAYRYKEPEGLVYGVRFKIEKEVRR